MPYRSPRAAARHALDSRTPPTTLYACVDATLSDSSTLAFSYVPERLGDPAGDVAAQIGRMIREGMIVTTGDSTIGGWVNLAQIVRFRIAALSPHRPADYPALDIWSRGNDDTEES